MTKNGKDVCSFNLSHFAVRQIEEIWWRFLFCLLSPIEVFTKSVWCFELFFRNGETSQTRRAERLQSQDSEYADSDYDFMQLCSLGDIHTEWMAKHVGQVWALNHCGLTSATQQWCKLCDPNLRLEQKVISLRPTRCKMKTRPCAVRVTDVTSGFSDNFCSGTSADGPSCFYSAPVPACAFNKYSLTITAGIHHILTGVLIRFILYRWNDGWREASLRACVPLDTPFLSFFFTLFSSPVTIISLLKTPRPSPAPLIWLDLSLPQSFIHAP